VIELDKGLTDTGGYFNINMDMIEYIKTTSIFEAVFSLLIKKYFPNIDNFWTSAEINTSASDILLLFISNPTVMSYSV
jgi:hypothetical protein